MDYQCQKDLCLHEGSCIVNENARLAIEKQAEVVKCLTQLSTVLSRGMHLQNGSVLGIEPQTMIGVENNTIAEPTTIPAPSTA